MIIHGIWGVFRILDPFDTTKTWGLFCHMDRFTLLTVVPHLEELHKTGYKHTIANLDCSGEYLQESMDLPLLTNSLAHVNVAPSGPEIMVAPILVIHASKFEIMEKVKDKLSAIKLYVFPG